jgi:hypothetical protein
MFRGQRWCWVVSCLVLAACTETHSLAASDAGRDAGSGDHVVCPAGLICTKADVAAGDQHGDGGHADAGSVEGCPRGFVCYPRTTSDAGSPHCPAGLICVQNDAATDTMDAGHPQCPHGFTCRSKDASIESKDAGVPPCPDGDICTPDDADDAATGLEGDSGEPVTHTPNPPSPFVVLDYRVVDAEESKSLKSLVLISDTPSNTLHIFDEVTQEDRGVTLPLAPVSVSVAPDGKNAAVAYDANVSWIDLEKATIRKTCPLSSNSYDVALVNAGIAYVVPRTDQWIALHTVDLNTCAEVNTSDSLRAGSHIALHPSSDAVFTADQGLSPSRIQRCNITVSPPTCVDAQGQADWGTYGYCGNLWISHDGQRIYSACGVTLRVPGNLNVDPCTYGGTLEGVSGITHISEAPDAQQVVLIPSGNDGTLRIQETNYLAFVKTASLPSFPLAGQATAQSHGRFVFTTPTLDMVYVVVQVDASSGALHDYAIATFAP